MTDGLNDIPYYAICSLAQLLRYVVSLVDNEVLVKDLEDFAALKVSHSYSVCLQDTPDDAIDQEYCALRCSDVIEDLRTLSISRARCALRVPLVRRWESELLCEQAGGKRWSQKNGRCCGDGWILYKVSTTSDQLGFRAFSRVSKEE